MHAEIYGRKDSCRGSCICSWFNDSGEYGGHGDGGAYNSYGLDTFVILMLLWVSTGTTAMEITPCMMLASICMKEILHADWGTGTRDARAPRVLFLLFVFFLKKSKLSTDLL